MSFTVQTSLDTKVPNVIELLGPPSATVVHQISGSLRLQVQKALQLKQLSVTFVGEGVHTFLPLFFAPPNMRERQRGYLN